jgi:hypothetical protein
LITIFRHYCRLIIDDAPPMPTLLHAIISLPLFTPPPPLRFARRYDAADADAAADIRQPRCRSARCHCFAITPLFAAFRCRCRHHAHELFFAASVRAGVIACFFINVLSPMSPPACRHSRHFRPLRHFDGRLRFCSASPRFITFFATPIRFSRAMPACQRAGRSRAEKSGARRREAMPASVFAARLPVFARSASFRRH